jgi:hypothetical protein
MKIIYGISGMDLSHAKQLGFDTVLGSFTTTELDTVQRLGLSCILHGKQEHFVVVAYYVVDEPEVQGMSIEAQDALIAEYKAFTDKPLALAIIESVKLHFSGTNFYHAE